jgi:excisionase family DNA binding protein
MRQAESAEVRAIAAWRTDLQCAFTCGTLLLGRPISGSRPGQFNLLAREGRCSVIQERLALSIEEAAQMLSVCRRTLESYISSGLLKSRKLGRRRVVLVADLHKFLSADKPSPASVQR